LDKSSRIWLYPGLQFARSAAFTALVPIGLPASLAIGAHVIARWVPYYVYRIAGKEWPQAPFFLTRLLFYGLLWITLATTRNFDALFTPTTALLLLWNLLRARKELRQTLAGIRRIDRKEPPST
jgi:hypothetical protein